MLLRKATTTGLLLFGLSSSAVAVSPCVERPTPPPCCADGHCYANPATWGWYETRWRRWPMDNLEPIPAGQVTPQQQQGVPAFETPPAEEEDRRAPPPTAPKEGVETGAPAKTETSPPAGPEGRTPSVPVKPSAEPAEPVGPRRMLPPYTPPQLPSTKPSTSSGPTSDADPPPSLPFGPSMSSGKSASAPLQIKRLPAIPASSPKLTVGVNTTSDDPPPALPGGLATALD